VGSFTTNMFWEGGQWNVALSGAVDGQVRLLATMTFDEWIGLSATPEACDVINTDRAAAGIANAAAGLQPNSLAQHQRIAALWRTADRHDGNLLHRHCIDHGH